MTGVVVLAKGEPVTAWQVLMPWVALLLAAVILFVVGFLVMCLIGAVRGDPWRCWVGHDWRPADDWAERWACSRCGKPAPECRNCGHQHDPDAWVICSVTRIGGR